MKPSRLPRHRKYQIGLTVGVVASTLLDIIGVSIVAVHIGLIISVLWIWEQ